MKKITIKPEYTPLTQQKLCCVPCAIQWVLLRKNLKLIHQEIIGKHLGLIVPRKYKHLFVENIKTSTRKPKGGWGTTKDSEKDINEFLNKYKIPLSVKEVPYSKIKNAADLIVKNLKKGNDVLAITWTTPLNEKKKFGHALLISAIELGKNPKVLLGDPDFKEKKFYWASLKKVIEGMDPKVGKTERGLYVFSKRQ